MKFSWFIPKRLVIDDEMPAKELDKISGGVTGRKKFSDVTLKAGV